MYHYVALAWPAHDPTASSEARRARASLLQAHGPSWKALVDTRGFAVYSGPTVDTALRAYVLPDDLGVIVGRLFASGPDTVLPIQDSQLPSTTIVKSKGRWLLDNFWGAYVAILRTERGVESCVLRDCSGRIPCFYLSLGALYIFFADASDVDCLGIPVSLNERYLAAFICRQPLHVRETGLNEITELLAGDSVIVSARGKSHESVWDPRRIAARRDERTYAEMAAALVATTEAVVHAWASLYERMLLCLSGGLDSSIVLGCLKQLGFAERVVCVTQYTAGTSDDERIYARAAAKMARVTLVEIPRMSDGRVFADMLRSLPRHPRPDVSSTGRMLALPALMQIAQEFRCDSLWKGQGGDQIFLQAHHAYGAADYLIQSATPWHLATQVYHSALLSGHSVWDVSWRAIKYRLRKDLIPPIALGGRGLRFLARSAAPSYSEECLAIPWRTAADGRISPGKLLQLDGYLDILNRHRPIVGHERPYEQHPLISQPLLELALQVPTYHLLRGGRQRGMAREAFADRIPPCIVMREDKGDIVDQVRSLLRGCAPVISDSLLNGALVSMGILDRSALEGILRQEETFFTDDVFPLLACIAAEAWIQQWHTRTGWPIGARPPLNVPVGTA